MYEFIIDAMNENGEFENNQMSICHFSTNGKSPLFLTFLSHVLTSFCPVCLFAIVKNKLMSVFHASVLLLILNFVMTLSK